MKSGGKTNKNLRAFVINCQILSMVTLLMWILLLLFYYYIIIIGVYLNWINVIISQNEQGHILHFHCVSNMDIPSYYYLWYIGNGCEFWTWTPTSLPFISSLRIMKTLPVYTFMQTHHVRKYCGLHIAIDNLHKYNISL